MTPEKPWQEGDVFRWSYKVLPDPSHQLSYWCCSQIGIVQGGYLCDTYWIVFQDGTLEFYEGRVFAEAERPKLNLKFLGNLNDFERRDERYKSVYDDADVMDLNHANSGRGNFYIRKGAAMSRDKMLAVARERLAEAQARESSARYAVELQQRQIAALEAGGDLDGICF